MTATRRRSAAVAALVGLLAALPFVGVLAAGLVNWDDDRFITANPRFAGPVGGYVLAALTDLQFEAYQPLHLLSYLPDRLLWPHGAAGFHALNLALHALAGALLFVLLQRHVAPLAAALGCLLFAWHPLLVEPVAWVSARKDLVAAILVLGCFTRRTAATRRAGGTGHGRRCSRWRPC